MMVDAAYDDLYRALRPGIRENELVGIAAKKLYDLGSEDVEAVNAIAGERCNRTRTSSRTACCAPVTPPTSTSSTPTWATGRATTGRSRSGAPPAMVDAYKRCRELLDVAISMVKPGVTTADIVATWPRAQGFGFPDEEACFGLQYGHGVGLSTGAAGHEPPGLA